MFVQEEIDDAAHDGERFCIVAIQIQIVVLDNDGHLPR